MKFEIEIHPIQAGIIKDLSLLRQSKFSTLNKIHIQNDWFSFHIKRLVRLEIIRKNEGGLYELTEYGKAISLQIDDQNYKVHKSSKVSILIIVEIKGKFVIQKRLIERFYGYYEFMTIRSSWGAFSIPYGEKKFFEETGLTIKLQFCGIDHKIDISERNQLFDDKYFLVFKGLMQCGKLLRSFAYGENLLMTKEEMLNGEKTHFDLKNVLTLYENKNISFLEIEGLVTSY